MTVITTLFIYAEKTRMRRGQRGSREGRDIRFVHVKAHDVWLFLHMHCNNYICCAMQIHLTITLTVIRHTVDEMLTRSITAFV